MIQEYGTLAEKFLKKGFWLYLFTFIIAPLAYITKIIISGELSVSEVGILYGIISLITLLTTYNDLGMSESLKYFIPKFVVKKEYEKVKTILCFAFLIQIFSSTIIAGLFYFGADFLAGNYFKSEAASGILKIFAFFIVGLNIFQTFNSFFIAVQNTFLHKFTEFIRIVFIMISVICMLFFDLSSLENYSYVWLIGLYLGTIISMAFFYIQYYKNYFKDVDFLRDWKLIKEIYSYSLVVFLGASVGTLLSQMDMQMVIYLLGTTEAGYYTNYLSIVGIPFMIIGPLTFGFLLPVFSELYSKGNIESIKNIKYVFQKNFLVLGLAFNILFFVFAHTIAYILFGEKFLESGSILKYSILFLVFNFLLQVNFNILAGIGQIKDRLKIIVIAIVFNFFTNILFIKMIGVYGAALATGVGWVLIWFLTEYYLGKKFRVSFALYFIVKNVIIMCAMGMFFYVSISPFFDGLSRFNSMMLLSTISTVWFLILFFINKREFQDFISSIRRFKTKI